MSFIFAPGGGGLEIPYSESSGANTVAQTFTEYTITDANGNARVNARGLRVQDSTPNDRVVIDNDNLFPIRVISPGVAGTRVGLSEERVDVDRADGRTAVLSTDGGLNAAMLVLSHTSADGRVVEVFGQTEAGGSAGGGDAVPATVLTYIKCTVNGNDGRIPVFAP